MAVNNSEKISSCGFLFLTPRPRGWVSQVRGPAHGYSSIVFTTLRCGLELQIDQVQGTGIL